MRIAPHCLDDRGHIDEDELQAMGRAETLSVSTETADLRKKQNSEDYTLASRELQANKLEVGNKVEARFGGMFGGNKYFAATITKTHTKKRRLATGKKVKECLHVDLLYEDGCIEKKLPIRFVRAWRTPDDSDIFIDSTVAAGSTRQSLGTTIMSSEQGATQTVETATTSDGGTVTDTV